MKSESIFDENPFFLNEGPIAIKEDQVFVILPFKNTIVFEKVIKPILSILKLKCIKADDIFTTISLMQNIANAIRESAIIIADLTGKNANVFYELGLAHAFKKRIILLTQNDEDVPSDLKAHKYYKYDINSTDGIANFEDMLRKLKYGINLSLIVDQRKKIYDISSTSGNEEQISSNFLSQEEGAFVIWAYLTDSHIKPIKSGKEWTYIISHVTNNGKQKEIITIDNNEEKKVLMYSDMWAIGRGANTTEAFYRLIFNNDARERHLICRNTLNIGWHMFSVLWSKDKNFIKFYVDDQFIDQSDFGFWPSNYAKYAFIGTWPSRHRGHYFNSKIGNWIIYKNAISFDKLKEYYLNDKPDEK